MSLYQQAINDLAQITGNDDEFGVTQTITAPTGQIAEVVGFHVRHHLTLTSEAVPINSTVASSTISEQNWLTANPDYPIRTNGEVNLQGHKVTAPDSTGQLRNYIVNEWFPDESRGIITLKLGDYEEA